MRPEYDFDYSKGIRGKYYKQLLKEGFSIVVLDPDVAESFRESSSVNEALRDLMANRSKKPLTKRISERNNPSYETGNARKVWDKHATAGSRRLRSGHKMTTEKDNTLHNL